MRDAYFFKINGAVKVFSKYLDFAENKSIILREPLIISWQSLTKKFLMYVPRKL